jgi:lysophospholipase L1-like esterase
MGLTLRMDMSMRGGLGGTGWWAPGSAVDMDFANSRYHGGTLSGLLSCSRASPATTYASNSAGLLLPFAANVARITNIGVLKEAGATNLFARSNDLANWGSGSGVTSAQTIVDPTGTSNSGWSCTQTGANTTDSRVQRNTTVANDSAVLCVSAYFLKNGSPLAYPSAQSVLTGGVSVTGGIVVDVVNGAVQATGSAANATIQDAGQFWRVSYTVTNNASGNVTLVTSFYPAWNISYSTTKSTVNGGVNGSAFWQIEAGVTVPSSFILTTTVGGIARSADNISLTGAIASVLASSTGSLGVATTQCQAATAGTLVDANGSILLGKTSSDTLTDNITAGLTTANTGVWTGATKSFISWSPSGRSLSLNNGTPATDATAMTPSATFHLGSTSGSSAFDNGYTSRLTAWGSVVAASFFSLSGIKFASMYAWGDSLTAGNEDGSGVTYPNALTALYSPTRTVVNEGVGGETSSQILTRFQALPASWNFPTLIWVGRNDSGSPATVIANVATMVSDLTTQEYVILSVLNGEGEGTGSAAYNNIATINASLASTYGSRYLDVRSTLVAAYNPANGADVIDHTNDIPPFSLRAVQSANSGTIVGAIGPSDTTFSVAGGTVGVATIMTVGTEYIYVTGIGGGGTSVTSCTRGYGGTTAASYGAGQAFSGTSFIHLNAAGYRMIAQWVYAKIQALGGW